MDVSRKPTLSAGSAWALFHHSTNNLHPLTACAVPVFTRSTAVAEALALHYALQHLLHHQPTLTSSCKAVLCLCDNRYTTQVLNRVWQPNSKHTLLFDALNSAIAQFATLGITISIKWLPSHVDFAPHDFVDVLANVGRQRHTAPYPPKILTSADLIRSPSPSANLIHQFWYSDPPSWPLPHGPVPPFPIVIPPGKPGSNHVLVPPP